MICGSCPYTDGLVYTSMPPKVRCIITGDFHEYAENCNCENARKVKESLDRSEAKVRELPSDTEYVALNGATDNTVAFPSFVTNSTITATAGLTATLGTPCLICGETVDIGFPCGPKICDACKKAILHVRENLEKAERCEAIYD